MLVLVVVCLCAVLAAASLAASVYVVFFAVAGLRVLAQARVAAEETADWPEAAHPSPQPVARFPVAAHFLVVVPAHNESTGLLPTLASLATIDYPGALYRTIVLADNCSDDTASVARDAGVEVWERNDPQAPGKGQALAWAFARAAATLAYDLLVVIDADTEVDGDFLTALDRAYREACARGEQGLALQGRYEFSSASAAAPDLAALRGAGTGAGSGSGWGAGSATNWFDALTVASKAAENSFVYCPRSALGLVTLLQGNGFAVSRDALARVPFQAGSIVEDAEYALALALGDVPVVYVDEARVCSRMTSRVADAAPQRLRWASGVLQLLAGSAMPLLRAAVRRTNWRLAEAAVMLLLTSRLLVVYCTAAALLLLPLARHTAYLRPLAAMLLAACLLQAVYLWLVLRRASATPVPLRTLCYLPVYLGFVGFAQGCAALGIRRGLWHRTVR